MADKNTALGIVALLRTWGHAHFSLHLVFFPLWMRLVLLSFHSYSSSLINVCVGLVACCPVFNLSISWVRAQIKSLPLMGLWLNLLNQPLHPKWGLIRSGPHKHTHDEHSLLLPCLLWSFAHSWMQKQNTFFSICIFIIKAKRNFFT